MPQNNRTRAVGQEVLSFESGLSIGPHYEIKRARQAASRRDKRIGKIARIKGFRRRTDGLFVPHSGTENTAVVELPENKVAQEERSASERVQAKYQDSDVPTSRVDLWAHFASRNARSNIRRYYRKFMHESATNAARIALALTVSDGEIHRDAFTLDLDYRIDPDSHSARHDVLAYNSVLKYFVDLETFPGTNPDLLNKNGRRKWPQIRNHRDYRQRMERAHEQLEPLAGDLFAERVDEAYWSHYSRNRFWIDVHNQRIDYEGQHRQNTSIPEPLPLEAYIGTPEYNGYPTE